MTGGRLNEILRISLDQFEWKKGNVLLNASKTENERRVPLVAPIAELVQARIRDGLTDETGLFKRAKVVTYDNAIGRACIKAAKIAKLKTAYWIASISTFSPVRIPTSSHHVSTNQCGNHGGAKMPQVSYIRRVITGYEAWSGCSASRG